MGYPRPRALLIVPNDTEHGREAVVGPTSTSLRARVAPLQTRAEAPAGVPQLLRIGFSAVHVARERAHVCRQGCRVDVQRKEEFRARVSAARQRDVELLLTYLRAKVPRREKRQEVPAG